MPWVTIEPAYQDQQQKILDIHALRNLTAEYKWQNQYIYLQVPIIIEIAWKERTMHKFPRTSFFYLAFIEGIHKTNPRWEKEVKK